MILEPFIFEPVYKETIWGGRNLEKVLNKNLPPDKKIGESWEVADHPNGTSIIATGDLKGKTFSEVFKIYRKDILGPKLYEKYKERFPLLIKFIDAQDKLSVQVHPDDNYAFKNENGSSGKTEAWYIVDAKPDSFLIAGFSRPTSKEEFEEKLQKEEVENLLGKIPVKKDDFIFIPAGRVHAIMPGIIINEIQQNSDITYRVYDWNRKKEDGKPRELHIKQSLETMNYNDYNVKKATIKKIDQNVSLLTKNSFFIIEKIELKNSFKNFSTVQTESFHICSVIQGKGSLKWEKGQLVIKTGDTFLVPYSCDLYSIEGKEITIIRSYI